MTKMLIATLIAFGTITAQAAATCNPEQEACPVDRVAGVPHWVETVNQWFINHGATQDGGICNPEQQACDMADGHVPSWVSDMNQWFVDHGAQPTNPFNDQTGQ
jgi:hypothetical protein